MLILDEKMVIKKYKELNTITAVANYFNVGNTTITCILQKNNVQINNAIELLRETKGCKIYKYSKDHILVDIYNSIGEASNWLVDNELSSSFEVARRSLQRNFNSNKLYKDFYWQMDKQSEKLRNKEIKRINSRETPSKTKLKNLIRNNNFVDIGKMYNVSDNTIRKWCKKYGLPYKKNDIQHLSEADWIAI